MTICGPADSPQLSIIARTLPFKMRLTVRDFEIAAGAGFLVALTGQMMRMPALPKVPAAERIDVTDSGDIIGI